MKNIITRTLSIYLNTLNLVSPKLGGKHAFYIFCFPFKAKIKKHHQEFLDTSHQFKLKVEGTDIQCYRWGSGPRNLLFVHGWQSNAFRWKNYIEELPQDQFTMFAFDAPGHGNSQGKISNVPLFEKAIKKIKCHMGEVDTIMSHSIGSFSTLYHVNQNPENQPKKLVSLATPNSIDDFLDYYFQMLKLSKKTIKNFKEYFTYYVQKDLDYFRLSTIINNNNNAEGLIIHDEEDQTVTVDYSKHLHRIWPQSQLIITNGLGHKLKSDQVIHQVQAFLNS